MAKYFYDTEFLEGTQKKWFGETKPTIDLISIGIVCEDGREFYAVSKDFNLKEAWNRYDEEINRHFPLGPEYNKIYWIRENVLQPIYKEFLLMEKAESLHIHIGSSEYQQLKEMVGRGEIKIPYPRFSECLKDFKRLLKKYGKTNKQIAKEIKNFCYSDIQTKDKGGQLVLGSFIPNEYPEIELYSYYSAYDHVALCWLFGKMIDLPKGFPMYTIDLKQTLDEYAKEFSKMVCYSSGNHTVWSIDETIKHLKSTYKMPSPKKGHHALEDARYNYELYKFLK